MTINGISVRVLRPHRNTGRWVNAILLPSRSGATRLHASSECSSFRLSAPLGTGAFPSTSCAPSTVASVGTSFAHGSPRTVVPSVVSPAFATASVVWGSQLCSESHRNPFLPGVHNVQRVRYRWLTSVRDRSPPQDYELELLNCRCRSILHVDELPVVLPFLHWWWSDREAVVSSDEAVVVVLESVRIRRLTGSRSEGCWCL
jgi:hypothetical protein